MKEEKMADASGNDGGAGENGGRTKYQCAICLEPFTRKLRAPIRFDFRSFLIFAFLPFRWGYYRPRNKIKMRNVDVSVIFFALHPFRWGFIGPEINEKCKNFHLNFVLIYNL
jgi:hypothetical protein